MKFRVYFFPLTFNQSINHSLFNNLVYFSSPIESTINLELSNFSSRSKIQYISLGGKFDNICEVSQLYTYSLTETL